MDVTFMPNLASLITRLKIDHPKLSFQPAEDFRWSPDEQTVFVNAELRDAYAFCLHEVSHAILGHSLYHHDIELVQLERDAWEYAKTVLAPQYDLAINDELIQDNLDTYRDWLHARSTCPSCSATGVQSRGKEYTCFACGQHWRSNEARTCGLKRYTSNSGKKQIPA